MPFFRKSALYTSGQSTTSKGQNRKINQYRPYVTAQRRHEYISGTPDIGAPAAIVANAYLLVTLAKFERSFGAGTDDEPTATSGNNYQTPKVMNGSYIENMNTTITLKNQAASNPATLTVYEIAMSWYDAFLLDGLNPSASIFDFVTASPNQGRVDERTLSTTKVLENTIKNKRFLERYYRKLGTVTFGNTDNASSTVTFTVNRIPPQCRRSQTGMYFGYLFVNDSDKNNAGTLAFEYSLENNFDERPSDNRLPYLA